MTIRLCVAVVLLMPAAALAQAGPGPFGGLFGRTPERIGREFTVLDVRSSVGAQYDDEVLTDELLPAGSQPNSGVTGGVNAGIAFERQSDRTLFNAHTSVTYQEFVRDPPFGATASDSGVLFHGQATTRLQIDGVARHRRSPFFHLVPGLTVPGEGSSVVVPGDPYAVRRLQNDNYEVMAGFTSQYSKRSSLSASVKRRQTRFERGLVQTFDVLGVQATWKRQLTRELGFRAGYGREQIHQSAVADSEFIHEALDIGVDYLKQLSIARRTTLSITTQTSMIKRPLTGRTYRVNGGLTVSRFFRRTWHASAGVTRATEFLPGFSEPLFSDNVSGSVEGMVSKRAEWFSSVHAGLGEFGFDESGRFLTATATTRLNVALTRYLGVYANYSFYYYEVPRGAAAVALLGQVSRQSVAVGFSTWVPIVNKVRAPRDPE